MKSKILRKADELFSKEGVREVSIDDICRALSISKKTFYQYFQQKEDLICDVLTMRADARAREFMRSVCGMGSIELIATSFEQLSKKRNFDAQPRDLADVEKYYPETYAKFMEKKAAVARERFIAGCDIGKAEGVIREDINSDVTLTMFFLLHQSMVDYIKGNNPFVGKKIPFKSMADAYEDIFVRTLLSEKGIKEYMEFKKSKNNS